MNQQNITKMTAVQSDLQKLEALLKSATNERQRKMYLSLLNKARAELVTDSAPSEQKTTESLTEKTQTTASTKKKARGVSSKKKASSTLDAAPASKKTSSQVNATSKKEKVSPNNGSIVVTSDVSASNNSTSVPETNQINADKGSAKTKTKSKAKKQSDSTNQTAFQGGGIIKCTPYLEDEKLFVTIDGQQYALEKVVGARRTRIDLLKSELEQNGSREMLLRVYPNITHFTDGRPPYHFFRLVQFYAHEEQYPEFPFEFIFRGIWRVVSHCPSPVITIYRNINRLGVYKNLSSLAQKYFAKAQDIPVVWDGTVEPYKHYRSRNKSEQMPCYFVQVRAIFKDGQYIVTEMLNEPTLEIPRFIQPPKKNRNSQNKSKQSNQTNQLDKESESNTEVV